MATFLIMGCSRPAVDTAKFTISLPAQKRMASTIGTSPLVNGILGHVVINIRGPGIDVPISLTYDADKSNQSGSPSQGLPSSFSVDIPAGSSRLIQVLAVYMDQVSMNGEFYYGDTTADLNSGNVNLPVPIAFAGAGNLDGGGVSGRYYSANAFTPTGNVETRFQPANGKPALIIDRSPMMSGWFKAFALNSIPLDLYAVPGNGAPEELIYHNFSLDLATVSDETKMKITVPNSFQYSGSSSSNSTGTSSMESRRSQAQLIGFFGPGVPSGLKVCYTIESYAFQNLFSTSTIGGPSLQWQANPAQNTSSDIVSTRLSTVGLCSPTPSPSSFVTEFPFDPSLLDSWGGGEALSGFYAIFKFQPPSGQGGRSPVAVFYDNAITTSPKLGVAFSLLPGIPDVVDSVAIFYRASNIPNDFWGNGNIPCAEISKGSYGFAKMTEIPLTHAILDYKTNFTAPADVSPNGNSVLAFCPQKAGVPVPGGFIHDHVSSQTATVGGGGSTAPTTPGTGAGTGSGTTASVNSFQAFTLFNNIGPGQCHRVNVNLINKDAAGNVLWNVTNGSDRTFLLSSSSGSTFYSTESACLSQNGTRLPNSQLTIATNFTLSEFWIKASTAPNSELISIIGTGLTFGGSDILQPLQLSISTPNPATNLRSNMDRISLNANSCQFIEIYSVDNAGTPSPLGSAVPILINKFDVILNSPVTDLSFDFYPDCNTTTNLPITGISMPAGSFKTSFAIKTSSTAIPAINTRKIQISGAISGQFTNIFDIFLNTTPIANYLNLNINGSQAFYERTCIPFTVQAMDSMGYITTTANFPFSLNIQNAIVSNDTYCSNANYSGSTPPSANNFLSIVNGVSALSLVAMNLNGFPQNITAYPRSPFVSFEKPMPLNVLAVEAFTRTSLKVHLTSDVLTPNLNTTNIPWPAPIGRPDLSPPSLSTTSAATGLNPKGEGLLFSTANSKMNGSINLSEADDFTMTVRFKLNTLAKVTILSLKNSASTSTSNYDLRIYVEQDSSNGSYHIKGTGGWSMSTELSINTWYTASLSRTGNQFSGFVTSNAAGSSTINAGTTTYNPPTTASSYPTFEVGGFDGAVKAVIIDSSPANSGAGALGNRDHAYLNNRVP